jgi:hypothetical protein
MSNESKTRTLGIPFGTACGRLRKNILFHLLTRLNENVCFKCRQPIEMVEDLSIEHKLPWESRSAELFWDLNNIAFSHLRCNVRHDSGAEKLRKIGPEGTAWCHRHKAFLPIEKFWKRRDTCNGLRRACSECEVRYDNRANHAKKQTQQPDGVMVTSPPPNR